MIVNYTSKELDLLARIMRAEAQTEGDLGMLMVGNVVVNRVLGDCYTFKEIDSVTDAIYQANQFSGVSSPLFQASSTTTEKNLAKRILMGEYYYPATHSLWFYAPGGTSASCLNTWYSQPLAGRYKNHCFYRPQSGTCTQIY
ncbi:MAG: cell wall hydrolase [Ruminococcus sp.]|nr:cell wall hydrolase [Ruminococcus sp.]